MYSIVFGHNNTVGIGRKFKNSKLVDHFGTQLFRNKLIISKKKYLNDFDKILYYTISRHEKIILERHILKKF